MDDPLNLMRVMPTQGGQPSDSAHGFMKKTNQERRKAGKKFLFDSDSFVPVFLINFSV
jgi:hypothetical protein